MGSIEYRGQAACASSHTESTGRTAPL